MYNLGVRITHFRICFAHFPCTRIYAQGGLRFLYFYLICGTYTSVTNTRNRRKVRYNLTFLRFRSPYFRCLWKLLFFPFTSETMSSTSSAGLSTVYLYLYCNSEFRSQRAKERKRIIKYYEHIVFVARANSIADWFILCSVFATVSSKCVHRRH